MYKVRTYRIPIRSVRSTSVTFSDHFSSLSSSRQCRSRPTLYATRYTPGGRGHAITNWQCISHAPPFGVSGTGVAFRAEHGMHMHNSKVINNKCSIPNVDHYFKAHNQYIICSPRWHTCRPHIRTPHILCKYMKYNIISTRFQTTL